MAKQKNISRDQVYNPFYKMFKKGMNTLSHRDGLHLFDQVLINKELISTENNYSEYKIL